MTFPLVKRTFLSTFFVFGFCLLLQAQIPTVNAYVTDQAGILSSTQLDDLNARIRNFTDSTSNQIAVLITPDIGDYSIDQFTIEFGHKNGVGKEGVDNGIAMVIVPKTRNTRGQVFIATGYGLEGAIPDAVANRIVDLEMIPQFKKQNYYQGISNAVDAVMKLAAGEISVQEYQKRARKNKKPVWPVALVILGVIAFTIFGKARKARRYSLANDLSFWAAWSLLSASSRNHSGYYNSFRGGSGGFGGGGFGGGGFGGFGGGGFGGGGAGGSW
ncbi:MAG: TPM domain-containing protein [Luteibaculum sp.]